MLVGNRRHRRPSGNKLYIDLQALTQVSLRLIDEIWVFRKLQDFGQFAPHL